MNTDPISDLLTRIRNAAKAGHGQISAPYSKIKENILKVMHEKGFIEAYEVSGEGIAKEVVVTLREDRRDLTLKRVSSPGQRIYVKNNELKPVKSGLGINIISTPQGVMSNIEAKKMKLGGEIICQIY